MTQKQILTKLNVQIDLLILEGKTATEEYQRLCSLHKTMTCSKK